MSSKNHKSQSIQLIEELESLKPEDMGTLKEKEIRKRVIAQLQVSPYNIKFISDAFQPYKDDKELALLVVTKAMKAIEFFSERLQTDPDVFIQGCSMSPDNILDLVDLTEQMTLWFKNDKIKVGEMSQKIKQVLSTKPQGYHFDALSLLNDTHENYTISKEECYDHIDWIINFLNDDSLRMKDIRNPALQEILNDELAKRSVISIKKCEVKENSVPKSRKSMKLQG